MSQQFKEQGGAATMDPGLLRRWITSRMMTRLSSLEYQTKNRERAEKKRRKAGLPHVVEYFHQADDGYSHLAIQLLQKLVHRYDIELRSHLVSAAVGDNAPEPELLLKLSAQDAREIAPHYGLGFPTQESSVTTERVRKTLAAFAGLDSDQFLARGASLSKALWNPDPSVLDSLVQEFGAVSELLIEQKIEESNARRAELKHYSGGMFFYGGEWYWGVDRLYHLELRLAELGLDRTPGEALIAPRQDVADGPLQDDGKLTLEIYPSLRSPYTAVVFDQAVELARRTNVSLKMRPVLPMVMRGVPATVEKGKYILFDTGREARAAGVPFGPCADPIGEPARCGYSLYKWAVELGKGVEFFSAFIRCAWVDAVNTNNLKGMRQVVERAGLDWQQAKDIIGQTGWETELEQNRLTMYELGLWGVPSFRLLGPDHEDLLSVWGQDRLWLVAKEIQKTLTEIAEK